MHVCAVVSPYGTQIYANVLHMVPAAMLVKAYTD